MKLSEKIRPTTYLKDHVEEIVQELGENPATLVITQDGTAKAILQDIESYERNQETMNMLLIYAMGLRQIEEGKVRPAEDVMADLRQRMKEKNGLQGIID